jgi:hypothetical protein
MTEYYVPGRSEFDRPVEYYENINLRSEIDEVTVRAMLRLKDNMTARFWKQWMTAKKLIDGIIDFAGIETKGNRDDLDPIYWPYADGGSELLEKLQSWFDRSGDKVRLKKRISELEQENSILRSLVRGE